MRVVRTVSGILLLILAVLAIATGGALWTVMHHEGTDGAFSGPVTGLSTSGYAIVVPDVDTLLRSHTSLAAGSGATVTIDARTAQGPAFIGLAPLAAVHTYLGPVPYARVSALSLGTGGVPVVLSPVAGSPAGRGVPAAQKFWTRTSTAGKLTFDPGDAATSGLALVLMRADGAPSVVVDAQASARAGWLTSSTWALFSLGVVIGSAAIVLLAWPVRKREIVYVVAPAQLPEIAKRLGVALPDFGLSADAAADGGVHAADAPANGGVRPADAPANGGAHAADAPANGGAHAADAPANGGARAADAPADSGARAADAPVDGMPLPSQRGDRPTDSPTRTAPAGAAGIDSGAGAPAVPTMPNSPMPDAFADPDVRATSLGNLMTMQPPTKTNEAGTYRSFGTPPPVTPSFLWTSPETENEPATQPQ